MQWLIDGYNLLHQSDLMGSARGPDWLERARGRLYQKLSEQLSPRQLQHITIVFDRVSRKQIDPQLQLESGIRVLFAVEYPEADDLIEELIRQHSFPKGLLLVSSDHRLQRAAKRRGASFVDADQWFDQLCEGRLRQEDSSAGAAPNERDDSLTDAEVNGWLDAFGIDEDAQRSREHSERIFPKDYGEDLLN